jgi:putative ATP-dependent endonuclease of the OLD family
LFLRRVKVLGFRGAVEQELVCEFPGRFATIVGANGAGKTTVADALYLAHSHTFPQLPRPTAATFGRNTQREIEVDFAFVTDGSGESLLGEALVAQSLPPPRWVRQLERSMGRVRATTVGNVSDALDQLRLIYLPAHRNPLDELARRETQILVELLRAEQLQSRGHRSLGDLRALASRLLEALTQADLIASVEGRVRTHLTALSAGVSPQYSFVGGQVIDDTYLARVLELLLGSVDDRALAQRLEVSGLGYVNLLHIAVTLAAIPDTAGGAGRAGLGVEPGDADHQTGAQAANPDGDGVPLTDAERLEQAEAEAESISDTFFPEQFHVTVVIEEPEAHLHPQLQYGLARYLRQVVAARPELQVILTSHAGEIVAACQPEELVVLRRNRQGGTISRVLAELPMFDSGRTLRMTKLHLDATRSAALFAENLVLVEGITDAILVRQFGHVWAADDAAKRRFVDALTITVIGSRVGRWPLDLLATPGSEIAARVAVLRDSDVRGGPPPPPPPAWMATFDPDVVRQFVSHPTLEPSLVAGNEGVVGQVLTAMAITATGVSPEAIDAMFLGGYRERKGEFAVTLADTIAERVSNRLDVTVPEHLRQMFDFMYGRGPVAE